METEGTLHFAFCIVNKKRKKNLEFVVRKKYWTIFTFDHTNYQLHPLCYQKPPPKLKIEVFLLLQEMITDRKKN